MAAVRGLRSSPSIISAGTPAIDRGLEGLAYPRVCCQTELVIATEVQKFAAIDLNRAALAAFHDAAASIEIPRPNVVQTFLKVVEPLIVHACSAGHREAAQHTAWRFEEPPPAVA